MTRSLTLFAGISLAMSSAAAATPVGQPLFAPEALKAHVEFLADDLLEGRKPGTRGFDVAARYVASQFQAIGLERANGGWYQAVPLVERTPNAAPGAQMRIGERSFAWGDSALWAISGEGEQRWEGEAVFAGYGVSSESADDAFAGLGVRGKAVVIFDRLPASIRPEDAGRIKADRVRKLVDLGAAGIVSLLDDDARAKAEWSQLREDYALPFMNWISADGTPFRRIAMRFSGLLDAEAAARLVAGSPVGFADIRAAANRGAPLPSFQLPARMTIEATNRWRRFSSDNVLGLVRGSDPQVADEYVLVTAHLDHVGIDPMAPGKDKIFNGALDNASGIAAMIEVARALAADSERARRSVMFVATTAEEIGLLGSDYLAENPLPQGGRVIAVVNLDGGVPPHELRKVVGHGSKHSTISEHLESVAARSGFPIVPDDLPADEYFERTDHFSFARRGVPAVYLVMGGSTEQERALFEPHIHQPGDDLKLPFNWAGGARFARIAHDVVRSLADAAEAPRWYADSPIGKRYAKGRPKAVRPSQAAKAER